MHKCYRCDHIWFERQTTMPKACPQCRSKSWNIEEVRKYKFTKMEIGQTVFEEWFYDNMKKNVRIIRALNQFSYRTKQKFKHYPKPLGMYIERVA